MTSEPFILRKGAVHAVPILHYNMEMAAAVRNAYQSLKPECVAVELPETLQLQLLHGASRLPDISLVVAWGNNGDPIYTLCEPCDGAFEALRSALDDQIAAFCIDLDVENYPEHKERFPDPYSLNLIGLQGYYQAYEKMVGVHERPSAIDQARELYMARRLKELSLSYDSILFVGGMAHVHRVLSHLDHPTFSTQKPPKREGIQLCTLTEPSTREVLVECGWMSKHYEQARAAEQPAPDRHKLLLRLYKAAIEPYEEWMGVEFAGYHLRNIMKFARNYALIKGGLMPDLFQLLSAAKGCVDHNYAHEVWELATTYPYLRNIDNLPELDLSIEDVWGRSKIIHFHMRQPRKKGLFSQNRRKDRSNFQFLPPSPFSICSYPPEDLVIENFGKFLRKKGVQLLQEQAAETKPFTTTLEDGLDTRETIRNWAEKKLYVKVSGRPPGGVGSIVVIFDDDTTDVKEKGKRGVTDKENKEDEGDEEDKEYEERYPWCVTWLGEHEQESDMAFYASEMGENVVGPGICRCSYGGFMMSYPPRRMFDVWNDPDYAEAQSKPEILLASAIDYAVKPVIVYVAEKPPHRKMKKYANRYGKKIAYIPIGQLSPLTLQKIRNFHVLEGHHRRPNADEYIP